MKGPDSNYDNDCVMSRYIETDTIGTTHSSTVAAAMGTQDESLVGTIHKKIVQKAPSINGYESG